MEATIEGRLLGPVETTPADERAAWAKAVLGDKLSGDDHRRILAAGRGASHSACYHRDCRWLLTMAHLDEIEYRAANEVAAQIVGDYLRSPLPKPIKGGSPEPADEPLPPLKPKTVKTAKGTARLSLVISGKSYKVSFVASQAKDVTKCVELRKADGTVYHVSQHAHGLECDCADFIYRRNHIDERGCKHIRATAVVGLVDDTPAPVKGGAPDPFGDMPRRVRSSGHGLPPSQRYTEATDGPGLNTSLVGHEG